MMIRAEERVLGNSGVRYWSPGLDRVVDLASHRLEADGVFVDLESPPPPGSLLEFELLGGSCPLLAGVVRVKSTRPTLAGSSPAGMAITFVDLQDVRGCSALSAALRADDELTRHAFFSSPVHPRLRRAEDQLALRAFTPAYRLRRTLLRGVVSAVMVGAATLAVAGAIASPSVMESVRRTGVESQTVSSVRAVAMPKATAWRHPTAKVQATQATPATTASVLYLRAEAPVARVAPSRRATRARALAPRPQVPSGAQDSSIDSGVEAPIPSGVQDLSIYSGVEEPPIPSAVENPPMPAVDAYEPDEI